MQACLELREGCAALICHGDDDDDDDDDDGYGDDNADAHVDVDLVVALVLAVVVVLVVVLTAVLAVLLAVAIISRPRWCSNCKCVVSAPESNGPHSQYSQSSQCCRTVIMDLRSYYQSVVMAPLLSSTTESHHQRGNSMSRGLGRGNPNHMTGNTLYSLESTLTHKR